MIRTIKVPRGEFPVHGDPPPVHGPFTRRQALRRALLRLAQWREDHE